MCVVSVCMLFFVAHYLMLIKMQFLVYSGIPTTIYTDIRYSTRIISVVYGSGLFLRWLFFLSLFYFAHSRKNCIHKLTHKSEHIRSHCTHHFLFLYHILSCICFCVCVYVRITSLVPFLLAMCVCARAYAVVVKYI